MNRFLLLCHAVLLLVVSGCQTMASSERTRADIVFLQPPHNRLIVDDPQIRISFEDAAKFVGQPCTCAAGGYRIAEAGLAALYGDARPVRGEVCLVASKDHAVSDVVAYILGAPRRQDPERTWFVVDPSLSDTPGVWRYIMADPIRRRAVVISYDKGKLMPDPMRSRLRAIEEAAEHGAIPQADRELFRSEMARMVGVLLDPDTAQAYVEVSPLSFDRFAGQYPSLAAHGKE